MYAATCTTVVLYDRKRRGGYTAWQPVQPLTFVRLSKGDIFLSTAPTLFVML